ncbi:MAG TPA: NUDIX hydrolase [Steroidobacteraceae bacterium]|jgi:ADP-ribose pyrophosphatase YjhB (NUDIX family)
MNVFDWARKVAAIAQTGQHFTTDPFDRDRYEKLQALVDKLLADELQRPLQDIQALWPAEKGYITPKVAVRGGVFKDGRILLVRETSDGKWCLPGGWVDVNDSPSQAVEREIFEESGYRAKAISLAGLQDRRRHPQPPSLFHNYVALFVCDLLSGSPKPSVETDAIDFFSRDALPELSLARMHPSQIELLFRHRENPALPAEFD